MISEERYMKRRQVSSVLLVTIVMVVGILGITNPGYKQTYQLFDTVEGKVTHNYFIFSVYQQYDGYSVDTTKKYRVYKRYIGIAKNFFEISSLRVKQE
jgi:hypothetical protein